MPCITVSHGTYPCVAWVLCSYHRLPGYSDTLYSPVCIQGIQYLVLGIGTCYFVLECVSRVLGTWYFVVEYYISRVPCTWYFVLTNVYPGYLITGTWNLVLCTHQCVSRVPCTWYLALGTLYSPVCIQGHNESCRPRFLHGLHLAKEIVGKVVTFEHRNDGCRSIFVIMSYMVIFVTVGSAICQDCWLTGI